MSATDAPVVAPEPARVATLLAPAAIYLAVRLVGVLALVWLSLTYGVSPVDRLRAWDGDWMLAIAQYGYSGVPERMLDGHGRHTPFTALAFFPGYPMTITVVAPLLGGNEVAAALVVSLLAGIAAAYGLTRIGELVPGGSRRVGLLLTALFAAAPMAVTLNMAYTEALFCALAAWSLVGLLQRRWLLAGVMCGLAGLVRPTSEALVLAVVVAAVVALVMRRDGWRPVAGALLSVAGVAGYLVFVAVRTGELTGWFTVQSTGWDGGVDGGVASVRFIVATLTSRDAALMYYVSAVVLIGVLVLFGLSVAARLPVPLLVYGGAVVATVWLSSGVMASRPRLLLPAFVLLLPIALGLAKRRPATAVSVVVVAALASAWFGAYSLTVWRYAI
ncbi:membrane protein [Pseudonocardia sulfidoxydans NBRC 16205]|uniref:Membrane protein n=1 Tax=Pseudonocardia sulfidoxydans NBRC 16205 TaxID=1223511 RepID=A0A511DFP3_9PSEU|nr:glycosyltransferase 87 family protein [Pseudonocardia sulfidoxydans]GEL23610.1 membrane protein [Pseudonocardia sulfidoxydans NBRC 16205]